MSFESMLAEVICHNFMKDCGKHQLSKPESERKAMKVYFRLPVDYDKEIGYRGLEMIIWGPQNYVQVWTRETWNVIDRDDLVYNEDEDEEFPAPGKDYRKGMTAWQKISDHDSGWRDGVQRVLRDNEVTGFNGDIFRLIDAKTLEF